MSEGSPAQSPERLGPIKRRGKGKPSGNKFMNLNSDADVPSPFRANAKSKSIGKKKDLVEAVRATNPATTNSAPNIFWQVEGNLKTSKIDVEGVSQQLTIVENGVNYSAKRFNDLRVANARAVAELKGKLDELDIQKKTWEDLTAMKQAETEEGRRIEQLNRDVKSVEEEITRKEHYTRQLEFVLQRLRRNQIKFDAHMNGMQEAVNGIERELKEVRFLRRNLDSGLGKAKQVEEETRKNLIQANQERDVLRRVRKEELKNAEMLQRWLENRDAAKLGLALELRGDLTEEEENVLLNQLREKQERTKNLQRANEEGLKLLQQMEEEFMLIKQVTGVSSIDEMLEKVQMQKPIKSNLEAEVREAEQKLAAAKKGTSELELQFQTLKSSGIGAADISREIIDKLEDDINVARQEYKITLALNQRLSGVLVGLQQGANGLLQRVHPYLHMADSSVFELTQQDDDSAWAESMEALSTAEQVLAKMMELCALGNAQGNKGHMYDDDNDDASNDGSRSKADSMMSGPTFANNVRIISKKALVMAEFGDRDQEDSRDVLNDGLDMIGGQNSAMEASEEDSSAEGAGLRGAIPLKAPGSASIEEDENVVPSRAVVKKLAVKSKIEAERKKDMDARRKKLADDLQACTVGAGAGVGSAARLRSQLNSAARLSTIHHPPTLPEGITLRDDAMTKTKAFITHMPNLI